MRVIAQESAMTEKNDDILTQLPQRLKEARLGMNLSMEGLSKLSGVSRSMVSQIERGESSPTIATLWHLTRALKLDFAALLDEAPAPVHIDVLRAKDVPVIDNLGDGCQLSVLSSTDTTGQYEMYQLTFETDGVLHRPPSKPGAREHLIVTEGTVDVSSGEGVERLSSGDSARYAADVQHRIASAHGPARAFLLFEDG
jgi:transcriptional regulator with XRE-family HTH domain